MDVCDSRIHFCLCDLKSTRASFGTERIGRSRRLSAMGDVYKSVVLQDLNPCQAIVNVLPRRIKRADICDVPFGLIMIVEEIVCDLFGNVNYSS
jgi:hypothetical protein